MNTLPPSLYAMLTKFDSKSEYEYCELFVFPFTRVNVFGGSQSTNKQAYWARRDARTFPPPPTPTTPHP